MPKIFKGLKPLKSSLREKKRYLVYEIYPKEAVKHKQVSQIKNVVVTNLKNVLGIWLSATSGIIHMDYSKNKGRGIIRVSHKSMDAVRASFVISNFDDFGATVIGVSGILKKARSRYLKIP